MRRGTLLQAAIDAGIITNNPSPVPQTPSNVEPPATETFITTNQPTMNRLNFSLKEIIAEADADHQAWGPEHPWDNDSRSVGRISLVDCLSNPNTCQPACPMPPAETPPELFSGLGDPPGGQNQAMDGADICVEYGPADPSLYLPGPDHDPYPGGVEMQVDRLRSFVLERKSRLSPGSCGKYGDKLVESIITMIPEHVVPDQFLRNASPVPPSWVTPADYLAAVFRAGENVLLVRDEKHIGFVYKVGEYGDEDIIPGEDGLLFCVNPVDGLTRRHQSHKSYGRRYRQSITDFRHLAVRFRWSNDRALRLIMMLPLQILSITRSGDDSVEILIFIPSRSHQDYLRQRDELIGRLVALGAYMNSTEMNGIVRLPWVRRGGEMQELLYLNPKPDCTAIFSGVGP